MNLLLDTHIFLWSLLEPERLSPRLTATLEDPQHQIWLSPITTWECLVLAARGRVRLDPDPVTWVRRELGRLGLAEAPLNHEVAIASRTIDLDQADPADRFLAATAAVYDLTLVTADERLLAGRGYSVLGNR
ncbi:MAG TPA: type II toxin-antitoxin system VapC family toxin [Kofleriaceae bacterium]|jgi:PIN domain nuclease of toxin-antitoxin system|nr:type II toxin-antitoxin system VapC family toxin [Kofleriaceae bacterium]